MSIFTKLCPEPCADWPDCSCIAPAYRSECKADCAILESRMAEFLGQIVTPDLVEKVRLRLVEIADEGQLSDGMAEYLRHSV